MPNNSPAKMGHFGQSHQSACPKRLHRRFRVSVAAYLMFQKTRNGESVQLGYLFYPTFSARILITIDGSLVSSFRVSKMPMSFSADTRTS